VGCYLIVWVIELSNVKNQEQKYTSALGGCQTTNKNATTNQKHAGSTGERWGMRYNQRGAQGEQDLIILGQSSWDIVTN
jgi:hypothetical protein